jgi:hypothetical protein
MVQPVAPLPRPSLAVNVYGIQGIVFLDLQARYVEGNSNKVYHVIVTLESDCTYYVYGAYGKFGKPIRAKLYHKGKLGSLCQNGFTADDIATLVSSIMDVKIRKGYYVTHYEHYHYEPAKLREFAIDMAKTLDEFNPIPYREPISDNIWGAKLVGRPFPADFLDLSAESEPVAEPVIAAPPRVRLSKEDWLKANYPEMSELPKWRFPGMVGV